jgi:UDP-N-acetylglucosamine 2-epimerase (non-hydrolysing)
LVIGTRPEAIKMAPVVAALRAADESETRIALTGQHTALVDQALDVFELQPDYDLEMMREGQSLYDVAHACLDGLPGILEDFAPDALLVQGDTATVCFGSMVGFFEDVRVGHVEAGLRSGRKRSPFPEEMFRRVSDLLSEWHFAPTLGAARNLLREGTDRASVHVTGNTVVDALRTVSRTPREPANPALREALASGRRMILLTAHRRESFGEPLRHVFRAVRALVQARDDIVVVYPVHPNPNVTEAARETLAGHPRILLTEPMEYLDLVLALRESSLVLTDSGGIQEEAPTFGTPVLVMREVTERPEGIEAGVAELVGTDGALLYERAQLLLERHRRPAGSASPYGDGRAGERIADIVLATLLDRPRRTTDWATP